VGRLNYEANYTWSHTINDMVNFLNNYSDPYDPRKDMGNADWDIRQNLTGSVTYNFPELKGANLFERTALGGWQTSSIVQTRTGAALNPDSHRNVLRPALTTQFDSGTPVRNPPAARGLTAQSALLTPTTTRSAYMARPSLQCQPGRPLDPWKRPAEQPSGS
jgi:hypothetical protein